VSLRVCFVSEKAISKTIANIFMKLDLPPSEDDKPSSHEPCWHVPEFADSARLKVDVDPLEREVPAPCCELATSLALISDPLP